MYTISCLWLSWMVIFKALVGCHDVLILGKSPIKWRQCPDMTKAANRDAKHNRECSGIVVERRTMNREVLGLIATAVIVLCP